MDSVNYYFPISLYLEVYIIITILIENILQFFFAHITTYAFFILIIIFYNPIFIIFVIKNSIITVINSF